ncbi:hypothetical protein ABB37_03962 [Leptomonas pyrrhocoris]|uniref:UBX domain-containing protein 11 n=1 Tax=Leptomonas pyrrhocoris TaxID=157538 RepID=A0A0M9G3R5_LEPPY|nr:hypothetical protein ABB37_03962 [Leptomonas pyrrhocoris]KPA81637.1 hypothetical protein ABB37_03962 [Leptomonas pyrrhocoris]|eukprot:XP_015660076.1 hypothetical protein ABB37_03962 [Leptomonas pyrrhocoris]
MDKGRRLVSKPLGSPQKYRPGVGTPNKKKRNALDDPLLLLPDVLDDATRRELLQEVLRPRRASPSSVERPAGNAGAVGVGGGCGPNGGGGAANLDKEPFANQLRSRVRAGSQNSDDLVTAMAARLKELESKHKAYQSELQELHGRYRQLNDTYQRERQLREEAETAVLTLYSEKELLEQQLGGFESATGTPRAGKGAGDSPSKDRRASQEGAPSTPSKTSPKKEKFDLFSGDFNENDGEKAAPTHFTNTARPGTLLFSPQKTRVGENAKQAPPPSHVSQQAPAHRDQRHSAATVDMAMLTKNARILSDYVGWKGVVRHGNQAGIRERDVVRVVIYKNGICVNRGPFRPYGWALCDAFLDDLMEGYYPYEFKEKYPDGFPIEITDCSTETCVVDEHGSPHAKAGGRSTAAGEGRSASSSPSPVFPSEGGRRLGGAPLEAGKPRPVHTLQDCKDGVGYNPVSAAEFLSKVPAQRVTASGQLVPVRSEMAALMGLKDGATAKASGSPAASNGPSNTVKRMAAAEAASRRAKIHPPPPPSPQQQPDSPSKRAVDGKAASTRSRSSSVVEGSFLAICVRLPTGQKVTLDAALKDTVATLREKFIAAAPQFARTSYELYQAFPVKCEWKERNRTLASLGIRRSCTLMVKLK